ncbi:putative membrane protein [Pediococcus damnosus]|uniref:Membrane protein n=1 Tax=Pediococcus damnosus TaxID=51663 RepID=A0A0R2HUM4_9LACO|nr:hypothetical protein [Pediococcus damnosus]AMV59978.1 putative membrane protein [Pediococcus damnosus]AMV62516.1 putative membrane protein [Pediococcus damnosus]AMV64221.1 putative membrane protein [Pediococcus damnosus]AMV67607.1 putative membrane protein [Pediococcus damnosus]AMV69050.1 putative membrane protein [Pediococcus damnosus]
MKTTKLVIGILMLVLAVFIIFQSMAAGMANALEGNIHTSGTNGVLVAFLYIIMGIVYLATRNSKKLGADITNLIFSILILIIGLSGAGNYSDLLIWSWLGFIIGAGFFIWHLSINRKLAV